MRRDRARSIATIAVLVLLADGAPLAAQGIEIAPIGGYRFGGDLFEAATAHRVDSDGAPALGLVLDVPIGGGLQFEALFSHQRSDVLVALDPFGPPDRLRVSVDHWQGGALQEFAFGRVRPFMTGMLGLTRYAAGADSAIRFTAGGGGGVKLFPTKTIGVRLDGRIFATIVDAGLSGLVCVNGGCLLFLHASVAWQAEFTAGVVVKLRGQ